MADQPPAQSEPKLSVRSSEAFLPFTGPPQPGDIPPPAQPVEDEAQKDRDEDGVWHEGPHRALANLALDDLLAALSDKEAREALAEVHEFQCGCDEPGRVDVCVAKPVSAFALLTDTDTPKKAYTGVRTTACHAGMDGECFWPDCPQLRDGEPKKSGRHCPLDKVPADTDTLSRDEGGQS